MAANDIRPHIDIMRKQAKEIRELLSFTHQSQRIKDALILLDALENRVNDIENTIEGWDVE